MFMDQQYSERMGRHLAKLRQDKGLTQEQLLDCRCRAVT